MVDRHILYLGEINDSQRTSWLKSIEAFDEHHQERRPLALFPSDRNIPDHAREFGVATARARRSIEPVQPCS